MFLLVLPVLLAQAPAVPLPRGFTPNPLEQRVLAAPGGSMALDILATCRGAPQGARVSKLPALTLEVAEGLGHLTFLISERGDGLVARDAAQNVFCSHAQELTLEAKPGRLELYVVTPDKLDPAAEVRITLRETDRAREPVVAEREVENVPDVQPEHAVALDPLRVLTRQPPDAALEMRTLSTWLPALDVDALYGWSREAQALRKRAWLELPPELFVFAAADGEVLLLTKVEGAQADVLSADGAQSTLQIDELTASPGSTLRVRPATLSEDVPVAALASERDPKLKSYQKLRRSLEACIAGPAKKCNATKLEKAQKKLEAELRRSFTHRHARELAQLEKQLKARFPARTEVAKR